MSDVQIRVIADSFEDLQVAIKRLKTCGAELVWQEQPAEGADRTPHAYARLQLYDTPETIDAKARVAGAMVKRLLGGGHYC